LDYTGVLERGSSRFCPRNLDLDFLPLWTNSLRPNPTGVQGGKNLLCTPGGGELTTKVGGAG